MKTSTKLKIARVIMITSILCSIILSIIAIDASTDVFKQQITIEHHTKEEIIAKAKELNIDFSFPDKLDEDYSLDKDNYKIGKLSNETQQAACDTLNFYRYVAGLPYDVELDEEYIEAAQTGALVNAAIDEMTHFPDKPENMDNEMYNLGYDACSHSNLAWNHGSLQKSMVNGWMDDSNKRNIALVGHRRWVLNPKMQYTGFGSVGAYTTMYAFDSSKNVKFTGDYVAWPAENTPIEMFKGSVFSVTLGTKYDMPDVEKVEVTMTSSTLNKTWTINNKNEDVSFYVNNDCYCMPKCIIFKTDDFNKEDNIHIRIDGITIKGVNAPIEYDINLFSMSTLTTPNNTIMIRPYYAADLDITSNSLLSKENPRIKYDVLDTSITNIYYFPHSEKIGFYGEQEGRTVVTASIPGQQIDFDIIVKDCLFYSGDADGDDTVDITDATVIQRVAADIPVAVYADYLADVNKDNSVTILDATIIQRHLAGIPTDTDVEQSRESFFTR